MPTLKSIRYQAISAESGEFVYLIKTAILIIVLSQSAYSQEAKSQLITNGQPINCLQTSEVVCSLPPTGVKTMKFNSKCRVTVRKYFQDKKIEDQMIETKGETSNTSWGWFDLLTAGQTKALESVFNAKEAQRLASHRMQEELESLLEYSSCP